MPLGINIQAGMLGGAGFDFLTNLIAYWKMGESSGNMLDSVNAYDLAVTGATRSATGKNGDAVDFDGSGDRLEIASASTSDLSLTGAFSFSAWIKCDVLTGTTQMIISKFKVGGNFQYALRIEGTSDLLTTYVTSDGSTSTTATSTAAITTGSFIHVFGCYDPSNTLRTYINGVLDGENTISIPASLYSAASKFRIGDRDGGNREFDGIIDEVAIWDAYRPELAAELYNAGAGVFYDDF